MTITTTDIAILASERLNDDADGGGFMTANPVQDNVENNLFPDISSLDRARGAMDFRKIYPAVMSNNADVFYGAHLIIDEAPADSEVGAVLVAGTSEAETRSQRIASLHTATFFGIKKIKTDLAADDQVIEIGSLTTRLIPATKVGASDSGTAVPVVSGAGYSNRLTYFPVGSMALVLSTDGYAAATFPPMPGSLVGATVTDAGGGPFNIVNIDDEGYPFAKVDHVLGVETAFADAGVVMVRANAGSPYAASAVAGNYTRSLSQALPVTIERITYTAAMSPVLSMTLADFSEVSSERIDWTDVDGVARSLVNAGLVSFVNGTSAGTPAATINRTTKGLSALLNPAPKVGTDIVVTYVKAGYIQAIASPGSFADGVASLTEAASYQFTKAFFRANSTDYYVDGVTVHRWIGPTLLQPAHPGAVVGSYNRTTKALAIPELPAGAVAISNWAGIQTSTLFPVDEVTGWTIPANLDPASVTISGKLSVDGSAWSATADADGAFSTALVTGTYDKGTGVLDLAFTAPVSSTINYAATRFTYTSVSQAVTGVNPAMFPTNGEVVAFRVNDVVVVHNTKTTAPAVVTTSSTITTRADISEARLIGADGQEIFTGFSVNKTTGNVTFTNVTGYSQPVTVRHRQEDMATVIGATAAGRLTLSKKLKHAYAAADSYVSSAMVMGDLQGKAHPGFQQASWLGNWSDSVGGAEILADFNETAYPITCTNRGAIKERWALIFVSTTAFRIVGEQVGEIGTGTTSTTTSPNNPVAGAPFWTINPLAFGAGWSVGNVYRFNTDGANAPAWLIRPINPSDPFVGQDKITAAVRGDINA